MSGEGAGQAELNLRDPTLKAGAHQAALKPDLIMVSVR